MMCHLYKFSAQWCHYFKCDIINSDIINYFLVVLSLDKLMHMDDEKLFFYLKNMDFVTTFEG